MICAQKKIKRPLKAVFLLFCLVAISNCAWAANLTSDKGLFGSAAQAYKDKKYSESLSQFKQLHDAGQCNDAVHYYMALCYQSMSQIASARQQYSLVSRSKDPNLNYNARAAISMLDWWNQHRLYAGNGNNFSRYGRPPARLRPITLRGPDNSARGGGGGGGGGC